MVEHRSPKLKVVGSNPITPVLFFVANLYCYGVFVLSFCVSVKQEMSKIVWASRAEVVSSLVVVIVVLLLSATFFGGVDIVFSKVVGNVLGMIYNG